nr:MAG TPA: Protein of unknown function (DUF1467) [Caudoviricetes sp.]
MGSGCPHALIVWWGAIVLFFLLPLDVRIKYVYNKERKEAKR